MKYNIHLIGRSDQIQVSDVMDIQSSDGFFWFWDHSCNVLLVLPCIGVERITLIDTEIKNESKKEAVKVESESDECTCLPNTCPPKWKGETGIGYGNTTSTGIRHSNTTSNTTSNCCVEPTPI